MSGESYTQRKAKGKRALMVWLERKTHQRLRVVAAGQDRRMVDIVEDALNEYLAKHITVLPAEMFDRLASDDKAGDGDG